LSYLDSEIVRSPIVKPDIKKYVRAFITYSPLVSSDALKSILFGYAFKLLLRLV